MIVVLDTSAAVEVVLQRKFTDKLFEKNKDMIKGILKGIIKYTK